MAELFQICNIIPQPIDIDRLPITQETCKMVSPPGDHDHNDIKSKNPDDIAAAIPRSQLTWEKFYISINGVLETTDTSRCSINPATEENGVQVPLSTQEDVEKAMISASAAFKHWAAVPYAKRKQAILEFADGLEAEAEPFAQMLVQEQGKPVSLKTSPLIFRFS